jgi:hypothetical protein
VLYTISDDMPEVSRSITSGQIAINLQDNVLSSCYKLRYAHSITMPVHLFHLKLFEKKFLNFKHGINIMTLMSYHSLLLNFLPLMAMLQV